MAHPSLRTAGNREMLKKLSERCHAQVVWIDAGESSVSSEILDDDTFTSAEVTRKSPAKASKNQDEEMELAMAASCSLAADANALAEGIAAEEAMDFERAVKLSKGTVEPRATSSAERGRDKELDDVLLASISVAMQEHEKREEEEELARAIQASLGASEAPLASCGEDDELNRAIKASLEPTSRIQFQADGAELVNAFSSMQVVEEPPQAVSIDIESETCAFESCNAGEKLAIEALDSQALHGYACNSDAAPENLDSPAASTSTQHELAGKLEHVLKASLGDDTRRLQVVWASGAPDSGVLAAFSEAVQRGFSLKLGQPFVLKYNDCDGDMLTLVTHTVHDFLSTQHGPFKISVHILAPPAAEFQDEAC